MKRINIKTITIKNLMSVGNVPVVLNMDTHRTNLITGKNGTGKSTLLIEALTYGLYGKPYRNINMPQLVNSINKKGLEVVVDFDVADVAYQIKRGIGPKVFEIYKDGVLVPEDASLGDYQDYLATKVLGVSYTSFKQIVVLGTAGYTPFMQLPPAKRREVVENLLDIGVISDMVGINKSRLEAINSEIIRVDHAISLLSQKKEMLVQQQADSAAAANSQVDALNGYINRLQGEIDSATNELTKLEGMMSKLSGALSAGSHVEEIPKLLSNTATLKGSIAERRKLYTFLKDHDTCPVCTQWIDVDYRDKKTFALDMEIDEIGLKLTSYQEQLDAMTALRNRDNQISTKLSSIKSDIVSNTQIIKSSNDTIANYRKQIDDLRSKVFTDFSSQIGLVEQKLELCHEQKGELRVDKYCHSVITQMLKDSGVKSVIISQYIPVINRLLADYLIKMGAVYSFEIDSEFNEKVNTRGMEKFTYESFSEGQKFRIDLAFLFAWRDLVKMISGGDFNVLIMDEIMDSASDLDGIECLVDILNGMKDNIYIISHSEKIDAMDFDRIIKVSMSSRFSEIETI